MHFVHRRCLLIAIAGITITMMAIVVVGVLGLMRGPSTATQPESSEHETSRSTTYQRPDRPRPLLITLDAELFARSISHGLFNWDTRYVGGPSPWAQVLVDVADPGEGPAVASDIRRFLPVTEMWEQLADYGTRQWLEVKSLDVPDAWSTALRQAAPGQIPQGASAFTIVGTAHREGTWGTDIIRTERDVTFTVFVRCPGAEPCTLLRLSQLDKPLK
ncbi:hypothetical protein [Mycetocola sp. 2940]|uniref:hypothetical protein n=1 Tax=Mycetocola sp. 2940 TaxID=3156452 RepID=UPI0033939161